MWNKPVEVSHFKNLLQKKKWNRLVTGSSDCVCVWCVCACRLDLQEGEIFVDFMAEGNTSVKEKKNDSCLGKTASRGEDQKEGI